MSAKTPDVRFVLVTGHTFGRRALEGLLASDAFLAKRLTCSLVVELAAERSGQTVGYTSVADLASAWAIPSVSTADGTLLSLRPEIMAARPHYLLVIGWSRLVASEVLDVPGTLWGAGPAASSSASGVRSYGCVGMHPTRLPQGRGQAPLPWTIINGVTRSALTTFVLEEKADTGPIIRQHDLPVRPDETAGSLFLRVADLHYRAGLDLAADLANRVVPSRPQNEAEASVWPRRRPSDSLIDLRAASGEIERHIRALLGPYPHACLRVGEEEIRIVGYWRPPDREPGKPGDVGAVLPAGLEVRTADAWLGLDVDPRDRAVLAAHVTEGMSLLT